MSFLNMAMHFIGVAVLVLFTGWMVEIALCAIRLYHFRLKTMLLAAEHALKHAQQIYKRK